MDKSSSPAATRTSLCQLPSNLALFLPLPCLSFKEEEPAKLPAATVTAAPAPDVQGDQEEDPGGQVGTSLSPMEETEAQKC